MYRVRTKYIATVQYKFDTLIYFLCSKIANTHRHIYKNSTIFLNLTASANKNLDV